MGSLPVYTYDVIIVGAGISGLSSLYNLQKRFPSWKVLAIEAGSSVGGTWFFNCYPGARFDSESITYQMTWDKELLQEWNWSEAFAAQEETLRYIERFAEKHSLKDNIQFNTTIASADWIQDDRCWSLYDTEGVQYRATFFVSCLGVLSNPTLPRIAGIEKFQGTSFHTSRFPKDLVPSRDFAGKRIGIIGTGATGIQTITSLSQEESIESLTVFQRTASWAAPLRNSKIDEAQMKEIKANYDQLFQHCAQTPSGFMHQADPRKTADVTEEEREALYQAVYDKPGFAKWLGAFSDTFTDRQANKLYSDFMAAKIRERVKDPATAEKLVPTTHGFGTRRVPLESGYFEAYNKANVHLVDIKEAPINDVVGNAIFTADGKQHELDVLIFATGFDAITGSFARIDFTSKSGHPLISRSSAKSGKDAIWRNSRPSTSMGIMVEDMPNMFMVLGPHQPFGNIPRSIEHSVEVVMRIFEHCSENGYTLVETSPEACADWGKHVEKLGEGQLVNEVDSWMTGVNTNVEGKTERYVARYAGSAVDYRSICEENRLNGWPTLSFE